VDYAFATRGLAELFAIADTSGQVRYEVRSVPDVAERLSLEDRGGSELAAIVRDYRTSGFAIEIGGERAALVRARGLLVRRYLIDGPALTVLGDPDRGRYTISRSDAADAAPRTQVVSTASGTGALRVRLQTDDGDDQPLLIAIALGIEYLCDDGRTNNAELRTAVRALRGIGHVWAR